MVKNADSMCKVHTSVRWAGLMKCAAGYERQRLVGWVRVQTARVQKTLSLLFLCSFRSSKLTPQPPCIFHDPCWLTSSRSASLSSPLPLARTTTHKQTLAQPHSAVFHSQLSYLPKPSKTISLTNSLTNSEWRFTLRRQRRQRRYWRGWKRVENEWMDLKRRSAKHDVWHLAYR